MGIENSNPRSDGAAATIFCQTETHLTVDLAAFEGPLDLLLHLIHELEIDIFDIPIVEITEQYLQSIQALNSLELNIASEYLVMAATLIEIKTALMLPKTTQNPQEPEADPRQDLVEQLIAYQQFQQVSHILADKQHARALTYPKEPSNLAVYQEKIPLTGQQLTPADLYQALEKMLDRLAAQQPLQVEIPGDHYTINEAIILIAEAFTDASKNNLSFFEILKEKIVTRESLVTIFLAMLELAKSGRLIFLQENSGGDIKLVWQGVGK